MTIAKCTCILPVALTALMLAAVTLVFLSFPSSRPVPSKVGVDAYLTTCAAAPADHADCHSLRGIQKTFGFDALSEIENMHQIMKKTAQDIAMGRLTDEAYDTCLKAATCARVPMLGKGENPDSSAARKISKTFWQLADGHNITPEICVLIPLCTTALKNKAIIFSNNKITGPRVNRSSVNKP